MSDMKPCRECSIEQDVLYNGVCVPCTSDNIRIYDSNGYFLIHDKNCPQDIFMALEGVSNKAIFHRAKAYNTRLAAEQALQVAIRRLSK